MDTEIHGKIAKTITAWGAIGVTSWAEAASFFACMYTIALLLEWLWKKVFKPIALRHGWVKTRDYSGVPDENE